MDDMMNEGLLTVAEAADFMRLSKVTIYALMGAGELGYVKIGRSRRIPKRALIELAKKSWVGPQPAIGGS